MPSHEECVLLEKKLEDTAEDLHKHLRSAQKSIEKVDNKLSEHIENFKIHEEAEKLKYNEYLDAQKVNTVAINHLVEQMQIQSQDTQGLIETWKAVISFSKGISWIRDTILWVCTTVIAVGSVYALFSSDELAKAIKDLF